MESSKGSPGPKPAAEELAEKLAALMRKWGGAEFAAGLRLATFRVLATEPGTDSGELMAIAAIAKRIDDHGAEDVLGALREASRIHGDTPAAADAYHDYSARIVDAVQRHFDHDQEDDDVFQAFREYI